MRSQRDIQTIKSLIDSYILDIKQKNEISSLSLTAYKKLTELISQIDNEELFQYVNAQIKSNLNSLKYALLKDHLNETAGKFYTKQLSVVASNSNFTQMSVWAHRWYAFDPTNADACYQCGLLSKQRGDLESALSYFTQSVSTNTQKLKSIHAKLKLKFPPNENDRHTQFILKSAENELAQYRFEIKNASEKYSHLAKKLYEFYISEAQKEADKGFDANAISNYLYALELYPNDLGIYTKMQQVIFNIYTEENFNIVREQIQILPDAKKVEFEQIMKSQHHYMNARIKNKEKEYFQALQNFCKTIIAYPQHPFAYDRLAFLCKHIAETSVKDQDCQKIDSLKLELIKLPDEQSNKLTHYVDKEFLRARSKFLFDNRHYLQAIEAFVALLNIVIADKEWEYNTFSYNCIVHSITSLTTEADVLHAIALTKSLEAKLPVDYSLKLQRIYQLQLSVIQSLRNFNEEKYIETIEHLTPAIKERRNDFSQYAYYRGLAYWKLNQTFNAVSDFILALPKISAELKKDLKHRLIESVKQLSQSGGEREINDVKILVQNLKNTSHKFKDLANSLKNILEYGIDLEELNTAKDQLYSNEDEDSQELHSNETQNSQESLAQETWRMINKM